MGRWGEFKRINKEKLNEAIRINEEQWRKFLILTKPTHEKKEVTNYDIENAHRRMVSKPTEKSREAVGSMYTHLKNTKQVWVLYYRFCENLSWRDIAKRLNLTHSGARYIFKSALKTIRKNFKRMP